MPQIPENQRLIDLAREYADLKISRQDFLEQRRDLLDEIDAKYNNRNYKIAEIVEDIRGKLNHWIARIKKN